MDQNVSPQPSLSTASSSRLDLGSLVGGAAGAARVSSATVVPDDFMASGLPVVKVPQGKTSGHEREASKRYVMEREVIYKSPVLPGLAGSRDQGQTAAQHQRTSSDTAPSPSKAGGGQLPRSHSIAASGDLMLSASAMREPHEFSSKQVDRVLQESLTAKKQLHDMAQKLDQSAKDAEFYRGEADGMRKRYADVKEEKQRLEQEISSLRLFLDDERKEMAELRRQQQELLSSSVGNSTEHTYSIMYSSLLRNYEDVKENNALCRRRYEDLMASHSAAVLKLEHAQDENQEYKKLYQNMVTERNQIKQQCSQAIRQWQQASRERTEYKDALAKVQRQHEDAVKEANQAMTVRIKASKDIKRLTDERNAAMHEYSLIMSERDSVHKEIEKLQEEVSETKKRMTLAESKSKSNDDEKRKLFCQIEMLKREIDQALTDRDKAVKEAHELRGKLGGGKMSSTYSDIEKLSNKSRFDMDKHKRDRDSASSDAIDSTGHQTGDVGKKDRLEDLDQANVEIDRLRKINEKLGGELQDANLEADVAKGRRDWAFSERDKVVLERESIKTLSDRLRRERDRAVSELAEALRDTDDARKERDHTSNENKDLRERLEALEKELRIKALHRFPAHSHSHDSAIDSDLQEWETENIDINMHGFGSSEELGLDLSGGRDDVHCPNGDRPIYISSIGKGTFLDGGKLKVNDCILRVNNLDCRDINRSTVLETLRSANSPVSLVVRRRKVGRRHQAVLHLGGGGQHGLSLDLGVYVSRIQPGSAAAKEGSIAVGDRIITINDHSLEHVDHIGEALKALNSGQEPLVLSLTKSVHSLSMAQPLSSSSSGHNMHEKLDEDKIVSPKSMTTSPIKDTIRGSREFVTKLLSNSGSSGSKDRNLASSSSSEKVYSVSKSSSKEHRGALGLMGTVKGKIDNVRQRRKESKEPIDRVESRENISSSRDHFEQHYDSAASDKVAEATVIAEFSYLDTYSTSSPPQQNVPTSDVMSVNTSSGGGVSSKKKKRAKDRDVIRNGGTWPRTRGGPIVELGTGTILHPQKVKKERLPLAELLNNLPKYPPASNAAAGATAALQQADDSLSVSRSHGSSSGSKSRVSLQPALGSQAVVLRNESASARPNRDSRRERPYTAYDPYRTEGAYKDDPMHPLLTSSQESSVANADHFINPGGALVYGSTLAPSDHSIDESVRSGHAGKEELQKYIRIMASQSHTGGKSSSISPPIAAQTSYSKLMPSAVSPSPPLISPPPSLSLSLGGGGATAYAALKAAKAGVGGGQFFPTSHGHASPLQQQHLHSSPRYRTPPPLVSALSGSDALLPSPIPQVATRTGTDAGQRSGHLYESPINSASPPAAYCHSPGPDYGSVAPTHRYRPGLPFAASSGHAYTMSKPHLSYAQYDTPPYYPSQTEAYSMYQHVPSQSPYRLQDEGVCPPLHQQDPYRYRTRWEPDNPRSSAAKASEIVASAGKSGTFPRKRRDRSGRYSHSHALEGEVGEAHAARLASATGSATLPSGRRPRSPNDIIGRNERKAVSRSKRRSSRELLLNSLDDSTDSSDVAADLHQQHQQRRAARKTKGARETKRDVKAFGSEKSPSGQRKARDNGNNKPPSASADELSSAVVTKPKGGSPALSAPRPPPPKPKPLFSDRSALFSRREELDFTSSREKSEEDKWKLVEESLREQQQLMHSRVAAAATTAATPRKMSKGLSRSQGDDLDGIADRPPPPPRARTATAAARDGVRDVAPAKATNAASDDDESHIYEEVAIAAFAPSSHAHSSPRMLERALQQPLEPPELFKSSAASSATANGKGASALLADRRHEASHEASSAPRCRLHASSTLGRNKRVRNRSLEMVLDDVSSSGSSSQKARDRDRAHNYSRSLERIKHKRSDRIPSNNSLSSGGSGTKTSSSSIDRPPPQHIRHPSAKCISPAHFSIRYVLPDGRELADSNCMRKPRPGDIRQIDIERSSREEPLGFSIEEGRASKGVFVSSVSESSLASQVGLQVGDQLLEVCGINLRVSGRKHAAIVLNQVRDSITMKVQFNPSEFPAFSPNELEENEEESEEEESESDSDDDHNRLPSVRSRHALQAVLAGGGAAQTQTLSTGAAASRSGTPTPRNSPRGSHRAKNASNLPFGDAATGVVAQSNFAVSRVPMNTSLPPSAHSTLTRHQIHQVVSALSQHLPRAASACEPRLVFPVMKKSGDLGVRLVGGNAVGIFIHSVEMESAAYSVGLRSADQILEYNGVDLRHATAEQAAYELAKPAEKVSILVHYNPERYEDIKEQPGDSYYVRSMFDRIVPSTEYGNDPPQLAFAKDDILYIDNTMYNGVPGHWSAWLVDQDGKRSQWGIIPSKYKVEEELLLKRSLGELESDSGASSASRSGRTWTTTRRSFFKRRKAARSSSRGEMGGAAAREAREGGIKELASFSDMASLSYSDSGALHLEEPLVHSYIRVERMDCNLVHRPVLIVGPLADAVVDKLVSDYPHKYARCEPKCTNWSQEDLDNAMLENNIIDFRRRGSHFECTTIESIKDICERKQHCILNIHLESVERLHHNHVYPIVLLIKFKSVKQIKEVKLPFFLADKISQKDAKNIFEHTQKLEAEYRHLISDTIHAGANLMLIQHQIDSKLNQEQNKTLWVPSGTIW